MTTDIDRNYDDLTETEKATSDAWWEQSGYETEDDVDNHVMDTAKAFLEAVADYCRLRSCNPAAPTPEVLLEQARLWLDNSVVLLASPADLERS